MIINPYKSPTSVYFESTERIIESRKSLTCLYCHHDLIKLKNKWYCSNCNQYFLKKDLPEEIYSEIRPVDSPEPIPRFGVNDKWSRVIGRKRND
jgi:hypothetical protein